MCVFVAGGAAQIPLPTMPTPPQSRVSLTVAAVTPPDRIGGAFAGARPRPSSGALEHSEWHAVAGARRGSNGVSEQESCRRQETRRGEDQGKLRWRALRTWCAVDEATLLRNS